MILNDNLKKYINIGLAVITLSVFAFITLKAALFSGRMGWEDEAHFWTMVKNCSIGEIFSLMRVEGHMLLWFLVVMPFAKITPYPYAMQFLNWLFCFGAILLVWKKAPFNVFIKIGITLSPIFMQLYAVHARCYSIGVFFLFFACALYKERLRKPYLYFTMLALAANTSLQGLIGAAALGIPFMCELYYDCFKSKKLGKPAVIITIFTVLIGIMFAFQFFKVAVPDYEQFGLTPRSLMTPLGVFIGVAPLALTVKKLVLYRIFAMRAMVFAVTLIFATRFKAFFVYFFTMAVSSVFFFSVYSPRSWHIAFYLVYFIMSYWIFSEEKPDRWLKNLLMGITLIFLACSARISVPPPVARDFVMPFVERNIETFKEGKVFTIITPITLSVSLPKLNEKGVYFYDLKGRNLSKYEGLSIYYDRKEKQIIPTEVYKHLASDKPNYVLTAVDINRLPMFYGVKNRLVFAEEVQRGLIFYLFEILDRDIKINQRF